MYKRVKKSDNKTIFTHKNVAKMEVTFDLDRITFQHLISSPRNINLLFRRHQFDHLVYGQKRVKIWVGRSE